MFKTVFTSLALLLALTACGPNGGFKVSLNGKFDSVNSPSNGDDSTDDGSGGGGSGGTGELGICSALPLDGITWPQALVLDDRRALALGLNISGSFEGRSGWANLSNNFDGQGFSFGLLNQNLGQGSLQPLFIKMRDRNGAVFKSLFTKSHYSSLLEMLSEYESSSFVSANFTSNDGRLSELDEPANVQNLSSDFVTGYSAISDSVDWAVDTLYSDNGKTFQAVWASELSNLGSHPGYVSLQIEASQKIHSKALDYMKTLKLTELRSYLFLFDVVVQNGGLYSDDLSDYAKYFGSTSPTETARLNKILELRLRQVKSEYKADVQARKTAIINGSGKVHGSSRNLQKDYCFTGRSAFKSADANLQASF